MAEHGFVGDALLLGGVSPKVNVFEFGFALEGGLQGGEVVDGGAWVYSVGRVGVGLTLRQPENILMG